MKGVPLIDESIFRAVDCADGRRCALPMRLLAQRLPDINPNAAIEALIDRGFEIMRVNIIEEVMALRGVSAYAYGARMNDAPTRVDCAGLMKYVFGRAGICLPRRSIQQARLGAPVASQDLQPGDLLFTRSRYRRDRKLHGDRDWVGHVGLHIGGGEAVHITVEDGCVMPVTLDAFFATGFSGARRIFIDEIVTAVIPDDWDTETADDLVCVVYDDLVMLRHRHKTPATP